MCSQNSASPRLCGELRLSQNSAPPPLRAEFHTSQNSASLRLCGELRLSQNSAPPRLRVKIPRLDLSKLSLNERHLVDFPQRGGSLPQLLHRGFAQERHPFFPRRALDLRSRPPVQDHFPDAVRQIQQLVNRRASAEPSPAALKTAGPFHHRNVPPFIRVQAAFDQHRVRVLHLVLAVLADHAHQPLRQDAVERRNKIG